MNLASGVLQATPGSTLTCTVTNTGSKPVKVTAVLRSFASGSSIATIDTCTGNPIAAGGSCVLDSGGFDSGSIGYCTVSAPSARIRGALAVVTESGVVTAALPPLK